MARPAMNKIELAGRRAAVTGGVPGIGLAIATDASDEGSVAAAAEATRDAFGGIEFLSTTLVASPRFEPAAWPGSVRLIRVRIPCSELRIL